MSKTLIFDCKMSCGGCSSAVERVITKNQEKLHIINFNISLEKQELVLEYDDLAGDVDDNLIFEKLKKTGKVVALRS
ncbi:hypothetical protein QEN19_002912 [Hanseniaspora menglaensis]